VSVAICAMTGAFFLSQEGGRRTSTVGRRPVRPARSQNVRSIRRQPLPRRGMRDVSSVSETVRSGTEPSTSSTMGSGTVVTVHRTLATRLGRSAPRHLMQAVSEASQARKPPSRCACGTQRVQAAKRLLDEPDLHLTRNTRCARRGWPLRGRSTTCSSGAESTRAPQKFRPPTQSIGHSRVDLMPAARMLRLVPRLV